MRIRWLKWNVLGLAFVFIGCHGGVPKQLEAWDEVPQETQRTQIVAHAEELSRYRDFRVEGKRFSRDCSGYVGAVLFRNGLDAFGNASELDIEGNGVRILREYVAKYGILFRQNPKPGDLVFFSNTYDRNRDHKPNDLFTHVGVVEKIEENGTVLFLHYIHGKVRRYALNETRPGAFRDENGNLLNSYLRKRGPRDHKGTRYLAGDLVDGYGSLVWDRPIRTSESLTRSDQSTSTGAPKGQRDVLK